MHLVSSTAVMSLKGPLDLSIFPPTGGIKGKKFESSKLKLDCCGCALLFKKGKVVIVGCKDLNSAAREISVKTKQVILEMPVVKNKVFHGKLDYPINLISTCNKLQTNGWLASYETELFPALVISRKKCNSKLQFFSKGKYVITGVKTKAEAVELMKNITGNIVYVIK